MTHVVTEACIRCKYTDCVDVCPVDCFREGPNFLTIDPDECIDCAVCIPECPVNAILPEEDVPGDQVAFIKLNAELARGTSSSGRIALTGHSGMHTAQSMHSSGSMVRKFGPSRKQSTGQTSTQSVYLQRMHDSRTTWVMA